MRPLWLIVCIACGGSKPATTAAEPAPILANLDCETLTARVTTCADEFEASYAKTEEAGRRGKQSLEGKPDGKKGAERLMTVFRAEHHRALAVELCTTTWAVRDPGWRERLLACDTHDACEAWASCAGSAIGDPMKPGYGKR